VDVYRLFYARVRNVGRMVQSQYYEHDGRFPGLARLRYLVAELRMCASGLPEDLRRRSYLLTSVDGPYREAMPLTVKIEWWLIAFCGACLFYAGWVRFLRWVLP